MFGRRPRARETPPAETPPLMAALSDVILARIAEPIDPARLPVTVACRQLIADTVAQLPIVALRDGRPIARQPAILTQPDPDEPRSQTLHRLAWSLTDPAAGGGNAYLLPTAYGADGWPLSAIVIWPTEVGARTDQIGRIVGWTWRGTSWDRDAIRWVPLLLDPSTAPLGTSPVALCRDALDAAGAAYRFARSYFTEGGSPAINLDLGPYGDAVKAAEMRDSWTAEHGGRRRVSATWGGTTVTPFGASAVDAALVEVLGWAQAEIARAYLMSPSLVNAPVGSSQTYATVVDEARRWLKFGLGGYLTRLEALFTQLLPRGQVARFDTTELERTDWAAQVESFVKLVDAGIAAPQTAHDALGLAGRPPSSPAPSPAPQQPQEVAP